MGDPRLDRFDGDEVWLRYRVVRRMHGSCEWKTRAIVRDARQPGCRAGNHDDRGIGRNAPRAGGLARRRCAGLWVLPVGQIMAAAALLAKISNPTDADINREITNLCRCGTYSRMRKAIHRAAQLVAERRERLRTQAR